jgi:hypothetical protein
VAEEKREAQEPTCTLQRAAHFPGRLTSYLFHGSDSLLQVHVTGELSAWSLLTRRSWASEV